MAYPLDACPPTVRDSNAFTDTLEANAPYSTMSDISVQVPPVADKDAPFVKSVRSSTTLTPNGGVRPPDANHLVGWSGQLEYNERKRLRDALKQIYDKAKATQPATGPIHPDAVQLLGALTIEGTKRLNEVKAIYDKWKARRLPSKYGDQTPDGRQDLNLNQAVKDYIVWAAPMKREDRARLYESMYFGQPQFLQEVGYQGNIFQMPENVFWSVLAVDQAHDRNKVRQLYREAYKMLWCAEYGVAQSQSYYSNKARFLAGPGGKQAGGGVATPPAGPKPPWMTFVPASIIGGGLQTTYMPGQSEPIPPPPQPGAQIPIPPPGQVEPPDLPTEPPVPPDAVPELPPDADAGEGPPVDSEPSPDAGLPPDALDEPYEGGPVAVPPPAVPTPWYGTAAAKTAFAVGAVGLAGWGLYAGYRYLTAPRYV